MMAARFVRRYADGHEIVAASMLGRSIEPGPGAAQQEARDASSEPGPPALSPPAAVAELEPPVEPHAAAGELESPAVPESMPGSPLMLPGTRGPRRPARYGLGIQFERRDGDPELARLVESTVWVNEAHPAFSRAVASRSEGYHVALSVAMALAPLAVEPQHGAS